MYCIYVWRPIMEASSLLENRGHLLFLDGAEKEIIT